MTDTHPPPANAAPPSSTDEPGDAARVRARMIERVVSPAVEALGYELVHLEWSQAGRRRRLQVFVDQDSGVGLQDCASLSPVVSNALDAAEAADEGGPLARMLSGAYVLEVSSPGLERPLSRRSQFERFAGRRVTIRTWAPLMAGERQRNFHGRIEATVADPAHPDDDTMGTIELRPDDGGEVHHIPVPQIRRANLVYEG